MQMKQQRIEQALICFEDLRSTEHGSVCRGLCRCLNGAIHFLSESYVENLKCEYCVMQVKDLASVSLKQPVRIFVNSNTDVAPYLRQEFVRIRPAKEGDREAIVAGSFASLLFSLQFVSRFMYITS